MDFARTPEQQTAFETTVKRAEADRHLAKARHYTNEAFLATNTRDRILNLHLAQQNRAWAYDIRIRVG